MNKRMALIATLIVVISLSLGFIKLSPEEGMYPMSEISKLDLVKAGLEIDPSEIYNPNGVSLIDALVKVGGCTGSFVSPDGLIITNHHCAFGAISRASTAENNYLRDGFIAKSREEEVPAEGYTVRIMESYEDVSDKILEAVEGIEDLAERSRAISKKMRELSKEASDKENSIEAQVSEMFIGQTYVLFKYRIIKDVRLVYAPPRSIGEFGGETDNWMWPRHTGDFSFMRAYVAPDGSAAAYSKENVPFKPKRYLKVNPNGVKEGDFTFIVGYPGRTYRHRPSNFLKYQQDFYLPYIANLYEWMIEQLEDISKNDETKKLIVAPYIKGLANTSKNYRGKLLGLKRLQLVAKKEAEENELQKFILQTPELKNKYENLFDEIDDVYGKLFDISEASTWSSRYFRFSTLVNIANFILEYKHQLALPNAKRKNSFKDKNLEKTISSLKRYYTYYFPELEERVHVHMINQALNFEKKVKIRKIEELFSNKKNNVEGFVKNLIANTKLTDYTFVSELLSKDFAEVENFNDPVLDYVKDLKKQKDELDNTNEEISGALSKLFPQLTEVKKAWKKQAFIPDANSTLRLTYGYIKGYKPADAVYYSPITTIDGVIDKANRGGEYQIPDKLRKLYERKDYGRFYDKDLKSLPVAILYNMDTTGGNSGSPILNSKGELIGVNFDRAFEATINDYAWNESYSRSIGVDIRYVLWITQKYSNGDYLLKEMGIEL